MEKPPVNLPATIGTARPPLIDLSTTTPTMLVDEIRAASRQALQLASDPLNVLDDNPFINREWIIVSVQLKIMADNMDKNFMVLFFPQH